MTASMIRNRPSPTSATGETTLAVLCLPCFNNRGTLTTISIPTVQPTWLGTGPKPRSSGVWYYSTEEIRHRLQMPTRTPFTSTQTGTKLPTGLFSCCQSKDKRCWTSSLGGQADGALAAHHIRQGQHQARRPRGTDPGNWHLPGPLGTEGLSTRGQGPQITRCVG